MVAIVSESGMTCFPQSNHSLDTFNTSHRLMIVPKEGPYGVRKEYYDVEKPFGTVTQVHIYLECYLTDYIKEHDASEWPGFVIRGTDRVPFYYNSYTAADDNYDVHHEQWDYYYVKYCYDEASGWWLQDKAYKDPYADGWGTGRYVETVAIEDLIKDTKDAIANGEDIRGKTEEPVPYPFEDKVTDTENPGPEKPEPEEPNPGEEITDPYADVNTLGATLTVSTDCIRVKKNNAPQKPVPKSVKIGKTALGRNKTFTVSYEKYDGEWKRVDAITNKGTYRMVITGCGGYEGICTKRLYVTADKTIKAMSQAQVKVNKMPYAGEPITSGVIKSVKLGGQNLVEGTDYTVSYTNNTEIGTAQVTLTAIEGKGILGTKTVHFQITENKISKAKAKGLSPVAYDPNKDMVQDMSKVTLTYGTKTLREDTDFTVSYINTAKAGTAKIMFKGKGIYNGTLTKTFKINKAGLSEDMLDDVSKDIKETYTGRAVKPEVGLKHGSVTLVKGKDYTLSYGNNTKPSTDAKPAQITVKGKGNYTGSFKINFTIVSDSSNTKTNSMDSKAEPEPVTEETVTDETIREEIEAATDETATEERTELMSDVTSEEQSVTEEEAVTEEITLAEETVTAEEAVTQETVTEEISDKEITVIIQETSGEETMTEESMTEEVTGDEKQTE